MKQALTFVLYPSQSRLTKILTLSITVFLLTLLVIVLLVIGSYMGASMEFSYILSQILYFSIEYIFPIFAVVLAFILLTTPLAWRNMTVVSDLCVVLKESRFRFREGIKVEKYLTIHMDGKEGIKKILTMTDTEATRYFIEEFANCLKHIQASVYHDDWFHGIISIEGTSPKVKEATIKKMNMSVKEDKFRIGKLIIACALGVKKCDGGVVEFFKVAKRNYKTNYTFSVSMEDLRVINFDVLYRFLNR